MTERVTTQRSAIVEEMAESVRAWQASQADKARRLALTQAELVDLLSGRAEEFSLDQLRFIQMLADASPSLPLERPQAGRS